MKPGRGNALPTDRYCLPLPVHNFESRSFGILLLSINHILKFSNANLMILAKGHFQHYRKYNGKTFLRAHEQKVKCENVHS